MKKFILFSIISVLLYSAPGHAGGASVKKSVTAALASLEEALAETLEEAAARSAALASLEEALAETQKETVARSAALASLEEAAARSAVAPAKEASAASLARQIVVCVGSFAQTVLDHAPGAISISQERKDALIKHLQRIDTMKDAIHDRSLCHPLVHMIPQEEQAKDGGLRRMADITASISSKAPHQVDVTLAEQARDEAIRMTDITAYAFSIRSKTCRQVDVYLAKRARDEELVSTILQTASDLQSAVAVALGEEEAAAVIEVEEATRKEKAAAWQVPEQEPLPVDAEEAQKVGKLQALCASIGANDGKLPPGMSLQKVVDLAEETSSKMEGTLSEMDIELLKMWEGEIAYNKEALGLSVMVRDMSKKASETVHGCYEALLEQKDGFFTPELTGPSFDAKNLSKRCCELVLDIDKLTEKTVQESLKYIHSSRKLFAILKECPGGVSLVKTMLEPLVESEEGAEVPVPSAPPLEEGE